MPQLLFPRPWRFEPIPGGYRVIDANGLALAHVYGQPSDAVAFSDKRLTNNEARRIAKLITRLPELVELEQDRNKARSRRKPQPLRFKPETIGDLIKSGKLLEVHCSSCRPARHLYIDAGASACQSACRCRRWPTIWSARNAARGTQTSARRSGPGRMRARPVLPAKILTTARID